MASNRDLSAVESDLIRDFLVRLTVSWCCDAFLDRMVKTCRAEFIVRREKARFLSGCESHPAVIASAGSNRSGRGGNEAAEASGVEGH